MIRTIQSIVLFAANLESSVTWYQVIFGKSPDVRSDKLVSFSITTDADLILVPGDGRTGRKSAALVCDDLDSALSAWRHYVGVVEAEHEGPEWPVRFALLRDPDDNLLLVLESHRRAGVSTP
jgi:hypothetical protein